MQVSTDYSHTDGGKWFHNILRFGKDGKGVIINNQTVEISWAHPDRIFTITLEDCHNT